MSRHHSSVTRLPRSTSVEYEDQSRSMRFQLRNSESASPITEPRPLVTISRNHPVYQTIKPISFVLQPKNNVAGISPRISVTPNSNTPESSPSNSDLEYSETVPENATSRASIISTTLSTTKTPSNSLPPLRFGSNALRFFYMPIGLAAMLWVAWHFFKHQSHQPMPSHFSDRLNTLEHSLASFILERDAYRNWQEKEMGRITRSSDLLQRYEALNSRMQRGESRAVELELHIRLGMTSQVDRLSEQVAVLQAQVLGRSLEEWVDDEARSRLSIVEDYMAAIDRRDLQASLDVPVIQNDTIDTDTIPPTQWNQEEDHLNRPDFALSSAGGRVIPSLTSSTLQIVPSGTNGVSRWWYTRYGRPGSTALHPDITSGNCWPLSGSAGQLGVMLAWPVVISDVVIDHITPELAFELTDAPREMELWGLVEGDNNIRAVSNWLLERKNRRDTAMEAGSPVQPEDQEWIAPTGLPHDAQYVRIAEFTYDIGSRSNIQTFVVPRHLRDLGVDFGVVILFVQNNWGNTHSTCLYRVRVYGQRAVAD